jgi:hypothetical protein
MRMMLIFRRGFGLVAAALLLGNAVPAAAQIDIAGEWAARVHEDQPHRVPGAELGDYSGLPINEAARQKARSWDAQRAPYRSYPAAPCGRGSGWRRALPSVLPVSRGRPRGQFRRRNRHLVVR